MATSTEALTLRRPASDGAHARYLATAHYPALHGLRFLCIAAVVWHHGGLILRDVMAVAPRVAHYGFVGVDLFFVLSGFLITTLLIRERAKYGAISLKAFFQRRAARILPPYFFIVSLIMVYYGIVKGDNTALSLAPYYYLFLSNFLDQHVAFLAITWSISIEEQYYLIWPFLFVLLPMRWLLPVLAVGVALNVAAIMGVFGVAAPTLGPLRFALPTSTYAPILMGSGLAIILASPGGFAWMWRIVSHRSAPALCLLAILVLLQFGPAALAGLPYLALHTLMSLLIAAVVVRPDHGLRGLLTARPVMRIGEISYGIYLYHHVGLHLAGVVATRAGLDWAWGHFALYAALSVILAEISFRTLEDWSRRLRPDGGARRRAEDAGAQGEISTPSRSSGPA